MHSGKPPVDNLAIRLLPCGKARARFVGPDGKPLARPNVFFEFVATPGPSAYSRRSEGDRDKLTADADFLANIDRKHYHNDPPTDSTNCSRSMRPVRCSATWLAPPVTMF